MMLYAQRAIGFLTRFKADRSGISAVEFAMILPVMLVIYFGGVEFSNALILDRKVTSATSTVADLIAQDTVINDQELADIFAAATAILVPFEDGNLQITATSVVSDMDGNTEVAWSDAFNGTPYPNGDTYELAEGLTSPGSSVIVVETSYTYASPIGMFLTGGGITIEDQFFMRPRRTLQIARVN